MKFGLKDRDYHFIKETLEQELPSNCRIYIFGSRARLEHREYSDIDLMIESSQDLSDCVGKILEIFEESSLPIKVDLIERRNFASSYAQNYEKEKYLFI